MIRQLCAAAGMILLSACVSIPPSKNAEPKTWQQHRAAVSAITGWDVRGKIAVSTGSKGGNATLRWQHQPDTDDIQLYGPFGAGRIQITADANRATLKDTRNPDTEGKTAAEVLYRRIGWHVPFAELQDWVRGIPASESEFTLDQVGRLKTLNENGWQVEYEKYLAVGDLFLPKKIILTANSDTIPTLTSDEKLRVTIVIKTWKLGSE